LPPCRASSSSRWSSLRITFPYVIFISLTALAGGILNTYSRFWVPAFTPVLLNLSFIAFALWLAPYFDPPVAALAWAVVAGGVAQLAFQVPFLARLDLLPRFRMNFRDAAVMRVMRQMAPAVFGVSIGQVSLLINVIFASFLVTGSVSWLYYADRLMEFPSGLLGAALGTILLPSLSRHHAAQSADEYSRLLDWGLRLSFLLAAPAAAALALLAAPLVTTLFHYGEFTAADVMATRRAVVAYSVGLVGLIVVKVLAPGFYARQDIRTPVKMAVAALLATQLMNLVFVWPLRHAGLALAIGLGACFNAALLYRGTAHARHLFASTGVVRLSPEARACPARDVDRVVVCVRRGCVVARGRCGGAGRTALGRGGSGGSDVLRRTVARGISRLRFLEAGLNEPHQSNGQELVARARRALVRAPGAWRGRPATVGRRTDTGARVDRVERRQSPARGLPRQGRADQLLGDLVHAVPRRDAVDKRVEEEAGRTPIRRAGGQRG
jgi:hypothetical protein